MTIPNFWEQAVFDTLSKRGYEVYLPWKDKGIDLLAIRNWDRPVSIQVKGSRVFTEPHRPDFLPGTWYTLNRKKVESMQDDVDVFVFVWPRFGKYGLPEIQFLVVPTAELIGKKSAYAESDSWHMYFSMGERASNTWQVADLREVSRNKTEPANIQRDDPKDYTKYLKWDVVDNLARGAGRLRTEV